MNTYTIHYKVKEVYEMTMTTDLDYDHLTPEQCDQWEAEITKTYNKWPYQANNVYEDYEVIEQETTR